MTDEEIKRAWCRFMRADLDGSPIWLQMADNGIDASSMQDVFCSVLRGDDTALMRLRTYLNAVAADVGSSAWQDIRN